MEEISTKNKIWFKMKFILNALEDGWSVKKREDNYVFTKKHENLLEIFEESYLENFISEMTISKKET